LLGVVNNHLPKNLNDIISIELPFNEAQQIVKAAKNVLSREESEITKHGISLEEINEILKQAEDQIQSIIKATSNKHLQVCSFSLSSFFSDPIHHSTNTRSHYHKHTYYHTIYNVISVSRKPLKEKFCNVYE
jgi:uncharacterized protein (DUF111 family)